MADNYGTVAGYKAYVEARNYPAAAVPDDDEDTLSALLVASEWLDGRYRSQFPGYKTGLRDQLREWPRVGAFDIYGYNIANDVIPREVENSTYEAAMRVVGGVNLTGDYTPGKYKRASVDGAVSVEFATFTYASDMQVQIPIIDAIIAPVLTATGKGGYSSFSGDAPRV